MLSFQKLTLNSFKPKLMVFSFHYVTKNVFRVKDYFKRTYYFIFHLIANPHGTEFNHLILYFFALSFLIS